MNKEKTILEWLSHLPDPYKSQAIENYDPEYFDPKNNYRYDKNPVANAIRNGFNWGNTPIGQGISYWGEILVRAANGEFDTRPIPWPAEADWSNAPEGTFARAIDENGKCYFYAIGKTENRQQNVWASIPPRFCGYIDDMTGIDWGNSLEFNTNLPR